MRPGAIGGSGGSSPRFSTGGFRGGLPPGPAPPSGMMAGVPAYEDFAKFYDQIMGDRSALIERVRGYVRSYLPDAGSLLELGCGTGAVLGGLADGLQVTGIDLSPEMLATAKAHLTGAHLVRADITEFSLGTTFDVVICVFDTLNHLPP